MKQSNLIRHLETKPLRMVPESESQIAIARAAVKRASIRGPSRKSNAATILVVALVFWIAYFLMRQFATSAPAIL